MNVTHLDAQLKSSVFLWVNHNITAYISPIGATHVTNECLVLI